MASDLVITGIKCANIRLTVDDAQEVPAAARAYLENLLASPLLSLVGAQPRCGRGSFPASASCLCEASPAWMSRYALVADPGVAANTAAAARSAIVSSIACRVAPSDVPSDMLM